MIITVLNNQSLLDIAIQYRGTAAAAFEIAAANNLSLTDDLKPGQVLVIPSTLFYNRDIADYYQGKGILPATAVTDNFMEELTDKGIGEMIINVNFIVR
jgi:LysM repeat protein